MIVYSSITALIILIAMIMRPSSKEGNRNLYTFIVFSGLCLLSACRSIQVGVDTMQYCTNFPYFALYDWGDFDRTRYEAGFFILCKTLNLFSSEYPILLVVTSLFIFASAGCFYGKASKDITVTSILFIALLIDAFFMSGMRQSLAIAVAFIGLLCLDRGKKATFVALILLASQFHSSAIIYLICWPLSTIRFSPKSFALFLLLSIVCVFSADTLFALGSDLLNKYGGYASETSKHGGSNYFGALIRAVFTLTLVSMAFFCLRQVEEEDHEGHTGQNTIFNPNFLMYMGMLALVFNVLGMGVEVFNRMSNYFTVFLPLLLPCAFEAIRGRKEYALIKGVTLTACVLYFIVIMVFRPAWLGVIPYSMWF